MRAKTHSCTLKTAWRKHWQKMKLLRERLTFSGFVFVAFAESNVNIVVVVLYLQLSGYVYFSRLLDVVNEELSVTVIIYG